MDLTRLDYGSATLTVCPTCWSIDFSPYYIRRRATDLLGSEVRSRNSVIPRPPLVTSSGENSVIYRLVVLAFRCQHGSAPPESTCLPISLEWPDSRRRLGSSNTAALVIARSKHSTSGDRAFPVEAA